MKKTNWMQMGLIGLGGMLFACGGGAASQGDTSQTRGAESGQVVLPDANLQVSSDLQARIKLTYDNLDSSDTSARTADLASGQNYAAFRLSTGPMSTSFGRPVDGFVPALTVVSGETVSVTEANLFYVVAEPSTNNPGQVVSGPFSPAAVAPVMTSSTSPRTELLMSAVDTSQQMDQGIQGAWPSRVVQLISMAQQLNAGPATQLLQNTLTASQSMDNGDVNVMLTQPVNNLMQDAISLVAKH